MHLGILLSRSRHRYGSSRTKRCELLFLNDYQIFIIWIHMVHRLVVREDGFLFHMPRYWPFSLIYLALLHKPDFGFRVPSIIVGGGAEILPNSLLKPGPIRLIIGQIWFKSIEPLLICLKLFQIETKILFVLRIVYGFRYLRFTR